jgi:hypothetical protein
MLVKSVNFSQVGEVSRFEAEVRAETAIQPEFTIRFDVHAPVEPPPTSGDAWLAALLAPAMFAGEDLEIRAPVSRRLTRTITEVQAILHAWFPVLLKRITVRTPLIALPTASAPEEDGAVVFFAGGVDSWYSLWKNRESVSDLLTVKGFDIPYQDQTIWPEEVAVHRQIAGEMGKHLITVETDIRDKVNPSGGCFQRPLAEDFWGRAWHGSCLAAIGLLLQNRYSQVIIPSSWQYTRLQPWGSHPMLDLLWCNGKVEFLHDGAEASRVDKIRVVSGLDTALRHLRVCAADPPAQYHNCGTCEKCRRTMLTLRLFGVLDRVKMFDRALDLREAETMAVSPHVFPLYHEILAEAEARGDAEVVRLVRILIGESLSARRLWHRFSTSVVPRWKRSVRKRVKRLKSLNPASAR